MSVPCGGCGRRKGENELLDDMVFDRYGKVKCSKIEGMMMPRLMEMVGGEMDGMRYTRWKTGEEHAYVKLVAKYDKMED